MALWGPEMLRARIIPCLLMRRGEIIKTVRFSDEKYIGDPLNIARIFNEKKADELMVLDIGATVDGYPPDFSLLANLAAECRMPLCYGGGISSLSQATEAIKLGIEKVAVSSAAISNPNLLTEISKEVGSQSVVAVIDYRSQRRLLSTSTVVCSHNGRKTYEIDPVVFARRLQDAGAGEIVLNSVDRDGSMAGYDLLLAERVKKDIRVPVTILGGAGSLGDIATLIKSFNLVGAAAGSLFVFKGRYKAVLINYPSHEEKINLCKLLPGRQEGI